MAAILGLTGVMVWQLRQTAQSNAEADITKLDRVLAEEAEQVFQAVDLVMSGIVDELKTTGINSAEQFQRDTTGPEFHEALRQKLAGLPQVDALTLIDAKGGVPSSSRAYPAPSVNVADRDYFMALRDHPEMQRFIGEPVLSRVTGNWTIFMARRVAAPDGTFIGLILASIELKYLENFYRDVNPGEGGSIALWRNDGILLVRHPVVADTVGQSFAASRFFKNVVAVEESGLTQIIGAIEPGPRLVAVRRLREFPLIATVGLANNAFLAPWRSQAIVLGVAGATASVAVALIAWLLVLRQFATYGLVARQRAQIDFETEARQRLELALESEKAALREYERAETALRQSERRFRDIAEVAGDWIWESGPDHCFTLLTGDSLQDMEQRGITRSRVLGRTRWEVAGVDPEKHEAWRCHKADLDARRPFRGFHYVVTDAAGRDVHISASGKPVFDETGNFSGYRGTATDETETINALQRAERAEALLRDAVDSISEGFVIFDHEDRLVVCNEGFRQLYPESAEWIVPGVRFEDILRGGLSKGQYRSAIGREEEWLAERLREHRQITGSVEQQLSDGRWSLVSERRMRNGGIAGLRIDITALKEVQAALRRSQEHLDRAQRIAGIGSAERDCASGRVEWSDENYRIYGVDRSSFVPRRENLFALVHPDDRDRLLEAIKQLENGIAQPPIEYRIIRPDGEVRYLSREQEAFFDETSTPPRVVRTISTIRDVTELRASQRRELELERQLLHSQKLEALGTLAGGIAHDLNNALMPILALSKLVMEEMQEGSSAREDLETIVRASARARDLVQRILAFSRNQDMVKQKVDLALVTHEALRMLRATLPATVQLVEHIAEVPPLLGDPGQLQQVIVNLVTNAMQAIGNRSGKVTVAISLAAERLPSPGGKGEAAAIRLSVADTGCGMDEATRNRIFEPFFTTKNVGEGTGLGLSVAHGIVTGHGGRIDVRSVPGEGTEFTVLLPACGEDEVVFPADQAMA